MLYHLALYMLSNGDCSVANVATRNGIAFVGYGDCSLTNVHCSNGFHAVKSASVESSILVTDDDSSYIGICVASFDNGESDAFLVVNK